MAGAVEAQEAVAWDRAARPPRTYAVASWLFLRLIGLAYLAAFWSLALQIRGLIGHDGILPAGEYITALTAFADRQHIGFDRFHLWPTLCWLATSDRFLDALCIAGIVLAALQVVGIAPTVVLTSLWIAYLSLTLVCRDFLSYQWDTLLLEAGLLAIPLAPLTWWDRFGKSADPPRVARWLIWWLLFRLMFGSGVVKLASGDPAWKGLTALTVHYETQQLPTPLAFYVSQLPVGFHKATTAIVLGLELIIPWCIFGPRRIRIAACVVLVAFQELIALTGNYAFFNLLTIGLALVLLDDATFEAFRPNRRSQGVRRRSGRAAWLAWAVAIATVPVSIVALTNQLSITLPGSALVDPLVRFVEPFRSVNSYGLFAVMTTTRPEIVVEGSNDGTTWLAYEFKYKPGQVDRPPSWVAPLQPRLDWQMWFAALGRFDQEAWFQHFCARLLEGSPSVLALLATDPFNGRPPRFVRSVLYRYRFANAATLRKTGVWWTRERLGQYSPTVSLRQPG